MAGARRCGLPLLPAAVFAAVAASAFYTLPAVWPDEGLFADPALSLLEQGRLATTLVGDLVPGMASRTYWMPPLYFLYLALVFAVSGASIFVMRLSSVAMGLALACIVWRIGRCLLPRGRDAAWAWLPVALLLVDVLYIRASLIARMELLTLVWVLLAFDQASRFLDRRRPLHAILAGACSGLACLSHPIGLAAPVTVAIIWVTMARSTREHAADWPATRTGAALLLLTALALTLTPWVWYVWQDVPLFVDQVGRQLSRKSGDALDARLYTFWLYLSPRLGVRLLTLVYLVAGLAGGLRLAARRRQYRPFAVGGFVVLALAVWGAEGWYVVYPLPFAALGVLGWLEASSRPWSPSEASPQTAQHLLQLSGLRPWKMSRIALAVVAVYAGVTLSEDARAVASSRRHDYRAFVAAIEREVLALAPRDALVVLDSVPDPYPGLLAWRHRVRFRAFSPVPTSPSATRALVARATIVLFGPYEPDRAIREAINATRDQWTRQVIDAGGYRAEVFVRRQERVRVLFSTLLVLPAAPAGTVGSSGMTRRHGVSRSEPLEVRRLAREGYVVPPRLIAALRR